MLEPFPYLQNGVRAAHKHLKMVTVEHLLEIQNPPLLICQLARSKDVINLLGILTHHLSAMLHPLPMHTCEIVLGKTKKHQRYCQHTRNNHAEVENYEIPYPTN